MTTEETGCIKQEWTADDKLKAVRRELGFRRRVYERRVGEGKMTQAQSDKEIGVFEAIEQDYAGLVRREQLL